MKTLGAGLLVVLLMCPVTHAGPVPQALFAVPSDAPVKGQHAVETRWGFKDSQGHWVIPPQFDSANHFANGYGRVEVKGRSGFVDRSGRLVVKPQFVEAKDVADGLAAVAVTQGDDRLWGFVDTTGRVVIEPRYIEAESFAEGLASVETTDKQWMAIDRSGQVVIPPASRRIGAFANGVAPIMSDESAGLIDRSGKTLWSLPGASWLYPTGSLYTFSVAHEDAEGLVDPAGHLIAEPQPDPKRWWTHQPTSEGLMPFLVKGRYGYRTAQGDFAIPPLFDEAHAFHDHLAAVRIQQQWGFIDRTGAYAVSPRFAEVRRFSEGLAGVRTGAKWGFIDRTGKLVIPATFDNVDRFAEGLCVAMIRNTKTQTRNIQLNGYIDTSGKWAIPPGWVHAEAFENGAAMVVPTYSDGSFRLIDHHGRVLGGGEHARFETGHPPLGQVTP
jgi:hypothetical protein